MGKIKMLKWVRWEKEEGFERQKEKGKKWG